MPSSSSTNVVVVDDAQRDQPREPPAVWPRAPRNRLLLSPFTPTQQPREVRGTRAAAPSVTLETSWIVVANMPTLRHGCADTQRLEGRPRQPSPKRRCSSELKSRQPRPVRPAV